MMYKLRGFQRTNSWDSVDMDEFEEVYPKEVTITKYFTKKQEE